MCLFVYTRERNRVGKKFKLKGIFVVIICVLVFVLDFYCVMNKFHDTLLYGVDVMAERFFLGGSFFL